MNKMTQQEFDAIERNENCIKVIPAYTDLTDIKAFGNGCRFGEGCRFGNGCSFGEGCRFGNGCSFGNGCRFGEGCSFGNGCRFGEGCSFGNGCRFGHGCRFGECCSFGEGCSYNEKEFIKYYQFGGFGSVGRTTRVYLLADNAVLIECGCQIGLTLEEFKARVESEYSADSKFGKEYRAIIAVIEVLVS